jgi:hypothetical protein
MQDVKRSEKFGTEMIMTKDAAGNFFVMTRQVLQRFFATAKDQDGSLRARERSHFSVGLLASMVVMLWSVAAFAQPTLEADCGTGATIVGSDTAGKVTLGTSVTSCTLVFSSTFPNAPACAATNETENGGNPQPMGTKSTTSSVMLGGNRPINAGDVVSYICAAY